MDDTSIQALEKLFFRKISLYGDLVACLSDEREALLNVDLERLWSVAQEKEQLACDIDAVQKEIALLVRPTTDQPPVPLNRVLDFIPRAHRPQFQKLTLSVVKLRGEAQVLREENIIHIEDSLQFLDGMIAIITGETDARIMYNDKCHIKKPRTQMLLSREV